MNETAMALVALVALLHGYFLVLEMFLWEKPLGRRTFGLSAEHARITKTMAQNQGLYNGFLAAGLAWGLLPGPMSLAIKTFFLACVIVAGVFGAFTANWRILIVQAVPAGLALMLTWLAA